MLNTLSGVVRNIAVLIILVTILEMLLPRKDLRPFVNMAVGIILILLLLAPLRFPEVLQPSNLALVDYFRGVTGDYFNKGDMAAKQEKIAEINSELTISRYKELLKEKITEILSAYGYEAAELTLKVEEDLKGNEPGKLLAVNVLARKLTGAGQTVDPVERVEVRVQDKQRETAGERCDTALEHHLSKALAVSAEIVEVRVTEQ